jgi:hypothetical protein
LQPAAFVFGNVDIAFGIHGGTNGIEQLTREEKPGAVADRRYDLASCVIQDIDFPLVLIDDINELLIGVASPGSGGRTTSKRCAARLIVALDF